MDENEKKQLITNMLYGICELYWNCLECILCDSKCNGDQFRNMDYEELKELFDIIVKTVNGEQKK